MPAKFKESEREYAKNSMGRRIDTAGQKMRKWKHHYLKQQSDATLLEAINSDRTKPKHKQKFRNELVRRGIKLVWVMPDGTQIEKSRKLLQEWLNKNPQTLEDSLRSMR